jgi:hypothetical protein
MDIIEAIIAAYPEINITDNFMELGIHLLDDGDGIVYIEKWTYSKPIPDGLSVGKPSNA